MTETAFVVADPAQRSRIAQPMPQNPLGPVAGIKDSTVPRRWESGGAGMVGTIGDYARFAQMLLNGGELDGRRYLKPESVKLMTSLQSGALKTGFTPGCGWGLGWCVVREPQGVTAMLSPGSFGHGGA